MRAACVCSSKQGRKVGGGGVIVFGKIFGGHPSYTGTSLPGPRLSSAAVTLKRVDEEGQRMDVQERQFSSDDECQVPRIPSTIHVLGRGRWG